MSRQMAIEEAHSHQPLYSAQRVCQHLTQEKVSVDRGIELTQKLDELS